MFDLIILKKEDNNGHIDKNQILEGAMCTSCKDFLVKGIHLSTERNLQTMFVKNGSILYCKEYLTNRALTCSFCICYDYKVCFLMRDNSIMKESIIPSYRRNKK